MTYQTKLWHFYWERLGYENNTLSIQCKHAKRVSESTPSATPERFREVKPPNPRGNKGSVG